MFIFEKGGLKDENNFPAPASPSYSRRCSRMCGVARVWFDLISNSCPSCSASRACSQFLKRQENRQAERKETNRLYKLQDRSERPHRKWQNMDRATAGDCWFKHMGRSIRQDAPVCYHHKKPDEWSKFCIILWKDTGTWIWLCLLQKSPGAPILQT